MSKGRKYTSIILALMLCAGTVAAQKDGGISTQMLQQMEKQQAANPANKALFNAIASNSIDTCEHMCYADIANKSSSA